MEKNFELIFDSNGGLIMSLLYGEKRAYVHAYDDMEQAAKDLNDFFSLEYSVEYWDGNMLNDEEFDPYCLELDIAAERNGAAFWAMEVTQIKHSVQIHSWINVQDFIKAWDALTLF